MSGIANSVRRLSIVAALAGLLVLPRVFASTNPDDEPSLGTVWEMVQEGQIHPAIALAKRLYDEKRLQPGDYAQLLTLVGDEEAVEQVMARPSSSARSRGISDEKFSIVPALGAIQNLAKSRRVVILNESHYDQRHRAFAQLLATRLREIGFTHFAAETFSPSITHSMEDGAPDGQSGVYVADPVFGDLVRQAGKMGYTLFPYEQTDAQRAIAQRENTDPRISREEAQAHNISSLLRDFPNARIFVYAGGSHLLETPDAAGREWMAALLRRHSGIDPLTIDQVAGTPHESTARESNIYISMKPILGRGISVAINEMGGYASKDGADLVIFHPNVAAPNARPRWLYMCGYRLPFDVQIGASEKRRLIRAFLLGEASGSIPVDQVLVAKGERQASLLLPTGRYRIEAQAESGLNSVLIASYDASKRKASDSLREYREASSCE